MHTIQYYLRLQRIFLQNFLGSREDRSIRQWGETRSSIVAFQRAASFANSPEWCWVKTHFLRWHLSYSAPWRAQHRSLSVESLTCLKYSEWRAGVLLWTTRVQERRMSSPCWLVLAAFSLISYYVLLAIQIRGGGSICQDSGLQLNLHPSRLTLMLFLVNVLQAYSGIRAGWREMEKLISVSWHCQYHHACTRLYTRLYRVPTWKGSLKGTLRSWQATGDTRNNFVLCKYWAVSREQWSWVSTRWLSILWNVVLAKRWEVVIYKSRLGFNIITEMGAPKFWHLRLRLCTESNWPPILPWLEPE